jgi:hypothetical protein
MVMFIGFVSKAHAVISNDREHREVGSKILPLLSFLGECHVTVSLTRESQGYMIMHVSRRQSSQ